MKKYFETINKIHFTERSVPWILLTACILAFGLLTPELGFYQDDWNYVYNSFVYGPEGIIEFSYYEGRPVASWVYILGFSILGYKPLYWHVASLLLRWLTATVLWSILKSIWPKNGWRNLVAALIFALYPFFTLQPLAVAYSMHWSGYLLYTLSIYLMLLALNNRFWVYTLLALLTQALHLFTLEYYSGIDLLRPILLWLALSSSNSSNREKFKSTLRKWAPYLAIFILFFIWRGFIYQAVTEGRNTPLLLTAFLDNPFSTIVTTINNGIPDLALILISSWYKLLEPTNLNFSNSANRYILLISIISFGIFYFFLARQKYSNEKSVSTTKQFFVVGAIALILSLIPVYAAGYVIHTKIEPWNSRFSLGSLLGAALIITSIVDYVIKVPKTRWVILSVIFGLLIGWHLQYTNNFRWAWDKQVNFYRQLYLRAPEITPGTVILSEDEFLMYMGDYPISYGINLIYASQGYGVENSRVADYWFFPLVEFYNNFEQYLNGRSFSTTRAGTTFDGKPEGSIVISFDPGLGQCLWVMRPEYASSKSFSKTMRQLASISYVDRIQQAPQNEDSFLFKYLYTNPEQDWCYYYQKADLAYQYEEWDKVIQLWEAANQNNLRPKNGFEYLPFIEAYAHSNDWDTAKKMTRSSEKTLQGIDPLLCNIWDKLEDSTPASTEKESVIASVKEDLRCDQE